MSISSAGLYPTYTRPTCLHLSLTFSASLIQFFSHGAPLFRSAFVEHCGQIGPFHIKKIAFVKSFELMRFYNAYHVGLLNFPIKYVLNIGKRSWNKNYLQQLYIIINVFYIYQSLKEQVQLS